MKNFVLFFIYLYYIIILIEIRLLNWVLFFLEEVVMRGV